jgi:hypothetical protein
MAHQRGDVRTSGAPDRWPKRSPSAWVASRPEPHEVWRSKPEFDAEAWFRTSPQASCGDLVESLDQLDVAVEVVEPLQLDVVLALPCRAGCDARGVCFQLAVQIGELGVVADDLGIETDNAVFDLAASRAVRALADGAQFVEVLLSDASTPAGAVSAVLHLAALLGEGPDIP